jgi:uncharacterized OB-fold protein
MATVLNDTLSLRRDIRHVEFSAPYWEASREKKLLIQYCKATGKYQHFPRPVSIFTGRIRDIEWREASGAGTVFSWTIAHRGTAAFRGVEPYAIVDVMLDVGVKVIANLVHCGADQVAVGMKVVPYWHKLEDGTHLLMFQPEGAAA